MSDPNARRYSAILFDLDGTLTDPYEGITGSIRHALRALGSADPEEQLGWCIGPPLEDSLARLLATDDAELIRRGILLYRERYATLGILEQDLYPFVPELLERLHNATRSRIFLATSKPRVYAERILAQYGLAELFNGCYGAELDGTRGRKDLLIAHLLEQERLEPESVLMVGDREHDIFGAKRNGADAVGVTYGYGDRRELIDAGADHICDSVPELLDLLLAHAA